MSVTIVINGETHAELPDGLNLSGLIDQLGLHPRKIAIERNREIVAKSSYQDTLLMDGDVLEIITFIGGG